MKEKAVETNSIVDQLLGHPYFWMTLAAICAFYFLIRTKSPEKVEWIELILEMMWELFLYVVTFQYLKDNNGPTERIMSLLMAGVMIFMAYKIIFGLI